MKIPHLEQTRASLTAAAPISVPAIGKVAKHCWHLASLSERDLT